MHACELCVMCVLLLEGSAGVQCIWLFMHLCVSFYLQKVHVHSSTSIFSLFFFNPCCGVTELGWIFIYSCARWIFTKNVIHCLFAASRCYALSVQDSRRPNASQKDCFSFLMCAGNTLKNPFLTIWGKPSHLEISWLPESNSRPELSDCLTCSFHQGVQRLKL